jgi:predicted outer membrane repeat protein
MAKPVTIQKNVSDGGGAIYGLGLIGALVYYILHATTFWEGLVGVFKAIVWPAFLIYGLLEFLKV